MMNNLPQAEGLTVEFKTDFREEAAETLVAFSNARGGTLYIGVSDKGKVLGMTFGQETVQKWINEIKNKTSPQIIPDVEVLTIDGKKVVALSVIEYPIKPVSIRGKYFKRTGNSNHVLSIDEIANEHLKTINSSWDMYPDPIHTLDDISLDNVQKVMEILKNKGMTINEPALPFLSKYSLLRDGRPTNAAFLMFKKWDYVTTTIELGRFQDPITIKDMARSKSDILAQVDEVLNYVKKHINLEVIITGNAQNTQKWQYPLEAIREIVLNMIIHRDYRSSSDSIVKIFNDKIEFYNPGRLPDSISIEDLLSNNYSSTPRNKKIAEVFKDMGLIEKYGSGIKRIIGYFREENLPMPDFRNISDGFMVTVFSTTIENNTVVTKKHTKKIGKRTDGKGTEKDTEKDTEKAQKENIKGTEKITKNQQVILDSIFQNPHITSNELSAIVGIRADKIRINLSKLKAKGIIERIGADRGGYWKVVNNT
ncbi:MAG: putative DNA binding domain-containing protein [Prevotellaceae bacterium]|jgi:ATP-dependent DNA helicase RecG|nr:putative DNA binding domain-containing protein [Prevotellaceae bacterium]